jgi:aerobic carbon-monoxide dehydrogenase small subunit
METRVRLTVNGQAVDRSVDVRRSLADFLRDDLALTGTHVGCEHGVCGACTVLVDGDSARSCLLLAVQLDGTTVTTIEGLTPAAGLSPLQEAFRKCHGLQCGFCTPGMIIVAHELLTPTATPTTAEIREALSGNVCMCTGYVEHPSPFTPLGAKGVGEGGAIPGPAAVANAVDDALAHLGVVVRSLPITPDTVWRWLEAARRPARV